MSTTWRYYPNPRRITFWRLVKSPHVYNCWMILNSRAMRSFVLILIEISIEKSKYGLLDLRVHKQNDNLVKENWNPILWYERKGDDLHFHFSFLPLSPSLFLLPAALAILAKHKIHCAVVPGLTSSHLKQYSALWYMYISWAPKCLLERFYITCTVQFWSIWCLQWTSYITQVCITTAKGRGSRAKGEAGGSKKYITRRD